MKKMMKLNLAMVGAMWLLVACRSTSHSTVEQQTRNVERQWVAKADSLTEHVADSVLVFVEKADSNIVRIVERKVRTREKIKVIRDTVVVYVRNDTISKMEAVKEKAKRSPPHWDFLPALCLLTVALMAIMCLTFIKKLKL